MATEEYRREVNPCYECGCDCYDADMGCTMPSIDKSYACPLENDKGDDGVTCTEFFMAMEPPTKTYQEKQVHVVNGKPHFYEPQELKAVRQKLTAHLGQHVPQEPYYCGVRLITKWCFPRGQHKDGSYRTTKPDTDNLQKLLKDCMTQCGYWEDDAQVASEIVEKFWAEVPGIYIRIEELT